MARRKGQSSLSPEEILAKREYLANFDYEQLDKMSRDRLRELCGGCLTFTSKDKKDHLIEKILEWTLPVRLEKYKAYEILKQELDSSEIDTYQVSKIVKSVDAKVAAYVIQGRMINAGYATTTRVKSLQPDFIKYVSEIKDVDYAQTFASELKRLNREDTKEVNTNYTRVTVPKNIEERKTISFNSVLDWAETQLKEKKSWKLVTLALTLTSGRRPVEIHSTGEFVITNIPNKKIREYSITKGWLEFTGQAKEKENMKYKKPVGTYTIPLLVDANLWMEGYQYLVQQGKAGKNDDGTLKAPKDKVNKVFSSDVSKIIKQVLGELRFEKWYDCRDFYAASYRAMQAQYEQTNDDIDIPGEELLLRSLLGHGESDVYTQLSYKKMRVVFK